MRVFSLFYIFILVSCQETFSIKSGNLSSVTQKTSWIKQIGFETLGTNSAGQENCIASTIDSAGNIYCAVNTYSSLGEANGGDSDAAVIKFNSNGEIVWIRQLGAVSAPGSTASDILYGIKRDADGNIFAAGYTSSSLAEPNAGNWDAFVIKLNSAGELQWIKQFGATTLPSGTSADQFFDLDLDPNGNIYLAGTTESSLFEANGGGRDNLIMKLDSDGELLWAKQFGAVTAPGAASSGAENCSAIKYKSDTEIYCVGSTASSFGEANGGGYDIFFIKFTSTGTVSWIRQLGAVTIGANAAATDTCAAIDIDNSGSIYCGGGTQGNLAEPNGGSNDIVIAKVDNAGNLIFLKQLGTTSLPNGENSGADLCTSIKVDTTGNIYCSGQTGSSLGEAFGGGTTNAFALKMSATGTIIWIQQLGADTFPSVVQLGQNMFRDLELFQGQVILSGRTNSNLVETNTGNAGDILVVKLNTDGSLEL